MDETTEKIIISLLSLITGSVFTYIGAVKISKKNRRLDANVKLYEAFRTTIRELEKNGGLDTQAAVMSSIGKQITEIERFRFHLSRCERETFIAAWNEYYQKCNEQKFTDNGQKEKRAELRQLALDHIYKILKFTGYK